jgi:hypothetical protein
MMPGVAQQGSLSDLVGRLLSEAHQQTASGRFADSAGRNVSQEVPEEITSGDQLEFLLREVDTLGIVVRLLAAEVDRLRTGRTN